MAASLKTSKRCLPPAHYSLKVESYSALCSAASQYVSGVFEAGGYKWRLLFHPYGDVEHNGENYISLYLTIVETHALPLHWEVNVALTLFVHDQIQDKYLAVQDGTNGGVKRFHPMKTTWGFAQLLPLESFKDPSNGYLVDNCCTFGAEVLVIKPTGNRETFSGLDSSMPDSIVTKKCERFSEFGDVYSTEEFTAGGKNWTIQICRGKRKLKYSIGIYLVASKWESTCGPTYSEFTLRLCDQINGKHLEREVFGWFCPPEEDCWGIDDFITLEELHNLSRGLIVNDCLVVEVELNALSVTKYGSNSS